MSTQATSDNTGALIVATPATDDPYTSKLEDPHITLLWFGEADLLPPELLPVVSDHCALLAGEFEPMDVKISGVALLGPDSASVLLVESRELVELRTALSASSAVQQAWEMAEQFPWPVFHLTTGYDGSLPKDPPETVRIDSIGLWVAGGQSPFPLGEDSQPVSGAACLIPTIECVDDIPVGINYATENPSARWYVTKRAQALGAAVRIPDSWMVPA